MAQRAVRSVKENIVFQGAAVKQGKPQFPQSFPRSIQTGNFYLHFRFLVAHFHFGRFPEKIISRWSDRSPPIASERIACFF